MIDEVNEIVADSVAGCCSYHGKLEAAKTELTEQGWLAKANAHLATHGLIADLVCFWVYNGQSSTQHMEFRVFTLISSSGQKLTSPLLEP